jgi:hypothetical protein
MGVVVTLPVSVGELIDKYTILSIKLQKIDDPAKKENLKKEYTHLVEAYLQLGRSYRSDIESCMVDLTIVNKELWEVEDKIREKERKREFDQEFISLARSVYIQNDRRAAIKKQIDLLSDSEITEEKSYDSYI